MMQSWFHTLNLWFCEISRLNIGMLLEDDSIWPIGVKTGHFQWMHVQQVMSVSDRLQF